jgi:2-phosphosulfolactate phosphatase
VPAPEILHLLDGARRARGVAVIIDVFRAFTVAPLLLSRGASAVSVVGTPEEALALKARHPDRLLVGERDGRPLPGFDFPNSPSALARAEVSGRSVVLRTSAGVQGLLAASNAEEVIAASFANAQAVVDYLRRHAAARVSLVCMGWVGRDVTLDDVACAEYLAEGLEGTFPPFGPVRERLRADPSGAKFFDPAQPWFPEEDFELCTRPSWLPVVPRLDRSASPARLLAATG